MPKESQAGSGSKKKNISSRELKRWERCRPAAAAWPKSALVSVQLPI